jgi:hypothetical protein
MFARDPSSHIWVEEHDLPKETVKTLYMLAELGLLP